MRIAEKIDHSDFYQVKLYKEGVFWIAYEQSAYAVSQVKELKPTKKFVKIVKSEIVSVGFPESALQQLLSHFEVNERKETEIILSTNLEIELLSFCRWKSSIPLHSSTHCDKEIFINKQSIPALNEKETDALHSIRMFAIANATPVECMMFLSEIQKTLFQ